MSRGETTSPLRGRYLVRNRPWNAALRIADALLSMLPRRNPSHGSLHPRRILIAIGGHLGDAVIATSVLPRIAQALPDAEIGMLLPSWSRDVVEGHRLVRWIHHVDHWKTNRQATSARAKWRHHRTSADRAVRELRAIHYDVAVDLYAYYPNSAHLLWRAGIPTRIGYSSGGCGPLHTTPVDWSPLGHTAVQHERLLREIGIPASDQPRYDLPALNPEAVDRARRLVGDQYIVVHPGTGDVRKEWPLDRWAELIERLSVAGERVVITGRGRAERGVARELSANRPSVIDIVDRADWPTFRAIVSNATLLIGADSVATHVAAAERVPTIAIMAAMSDPEFWRPLGPHVAVLTRRLPCAPCFRKHGCAAMSCVRDVSVDEVERAAATLRVPRRRTASV